MDDTVVAAHRTTEVEEGVAVAERAAQGRGALLSLGDDQRRHSELAWSPESLGCEGVEKLRRWELSIGTGEDPERSLFEVSTNQSS